MTSSLPIVTFCSRDYIPVLANFLAALQKTGERQVRVYGLDADTVALAEAAGLEAVGLSWDGSFGSLWSARIEVFRNLVGAGQDFVHSDADAIWLRDPVEDWMSTDTDMIFSQGTIHPSDAHAAVGFVLCCGLFRINATAASARFLDLVAEHVVSTGDDQYSVNEVLRTNGAAWDKATVPDYRLRMRGKSFSCWKNPIEGECAQLGLRVALIPHSVVQRIHDPIDTNGRVCVKHLLTPKKAGEKLDRLRREGLLFIREDWRELPPQASFKDYLAPQG